TVGTGPTAPPSCGPGSWSRRRSSPFVTPTRRDGWALMFTTPQPHSLTLTESFHVEEVGQPPGVPGDQRGRRGRPEPVGQELRQDRRGQRQGEHRLPGRRRPLPAAHRRHPGDEAEGPAGRAGRRVRRV